MRLAFPSTPALAGDLATPAAAEQHCCAFFDFALSLAPPARPPDADGARARSRGLPAHRPVRGHRMNPGTKPFATSLLAGPGVLCAAR
ncbi:hypothetical protein [Streptomyces virginiae]|uniref:hypothetical protein n=1 Tax=Streptomyces virginiae TaxID=1961 RepID=UPI003429223E